MKQKLFLTLLAMVTLMVACPSADAGCRNPYSSGGFGYYGGYGNYGGANQGYYTQARPVQVNAGNVYTGIPTYGPITGSYPQPIQMAPTQPVYQQNSYNNGIPVTTYYVPPAYNTYPPQQQYYNGYPVPYNNYGNTYGTTTTTTTFPGGSMTVQDQFNNTGW